MKASIEKLHKIANKKERLIIGLMSGTSLDGLDVALCRVCGFGIETKVELLNFKTFNFSKADKNKIREVFAKDNINFPYLTLLNQWVAKKHGELVLKALSEWNLKPEEIDLIASHGQTVMHVPKNSHNYSEFSDATLQIGDGDKIAVDTKIITISDFRQKHIAAGGEGAPLALYGDLLIFSSKTENRILLNMGGISNYTFLPKGSDFTKCFATDTGPGNTLLDAVTRKHFPNMAYDKDSLLAKKGVINNLLLSELKSHSFFKKELPKTTGPELFNLEYVDSCIKKTDSKISVYDLLATLTQFSAETVSESIKESIAKVEDKKFSVYTSGGGARNPLLVKCISDLLGLEIKKIDSLGIDSDAKEAVLFAILANETVAGGEVKYSKDLRIPSVSLGKISFSK